MRPTIYSGLIGLILFCLLCLEVKGQGGNELKKLAFIIGNKEYKHATPLKNTINDAEDMNATLKTLGFETMLFTNVDYSQFIKAINEFGEKAPKYDVLLFYFSGHGMMFLGENYLVPVDAALLNNEKQIEVECINIKRVMANFNAGDGKANIAIVDACRNKPFNRSWANVSRDIIVGNQIKLRGFSGSIVAQSADEGETSSDNPKGRNGLYTSSLIKYMKEPGLSINEVFQLTRKEVKEHSGDKQNPIEFNQLVGNFYFSPTSNNNNIASAKPTTTKNKQDLQKNKKEELPSTRKENSGNTKSEDPPVTSVNNRPAGNKILKLTEGISIRLELIEALNSKTASIGDPVELQVVDDVEVDGVVVIKSSTSVRGEITEASKAKMLGQQGKLDFVVNYATSVDNQKIRLRSTRKYEGKNQSAGMAVAAMIALPAIFIKGKEAIIPKGTKFNAFVDKDYTIRVAD